MIVRNTLLSVAIAGLMATPLAAQADNVRFNVQIGPPAPVVEHFAPRHGYVVVPGYYRYDSGHHKHVWVKGHYERERHGYRYVAPEWQERDGRYGLRAGHWEREH
jgi:hypothetical protein